MIKNQIFTKSIFSFLIIQLVYSQFRIISNKELINKFEELYPQGNIDLLHSNFGVQPYGHVITGQILQPPLNQSDLCTQFILDNKEYQSFFLLADRGNCSFVYKTLMAQRMGAKLLIIADQFDEFDVQIMSDDKSGVHLRIPAIMINKKDAQLIKNALSTNNQVIAKYEIQHPNRKHVVELEYWFGLFSSSSYPFLIQFLNFYLNLSEINQKRLIFVPKFELWYCYSCKKFGNFTSDDQDCISGGRYCQSDPDGGGALKGQDVVKEILHQICIQKLAGTVNYLQYIKSFKEAVVYYPKDDRKGKMEENFKQIISQNLQNQVLQCIKDSYKGEKEQQYDDNFLLEEMRNQQLYRESDIVSFPALIVNNMTFEGDIQEEDATFEFICSTFIDPPENCDQFDRRLGYDQIDKLIGDKDSGSEKPGNLDYFSIVLWISLFTIFILIIFLYCCRRLIKKEINLKVQDEAAIQIKKYFKLKEIISNKK